MINNFLKVYALPWLVISAFLSACQDSKPHLKKVNFHELPGWHDDHIIEALPALKKSCQVITKRPTTTPMHTSAHTPGKAEDWHKFCHDLHLQPVRTTPQLRQLLEEHLDPYHVSEEGKPHGTFTGYYEPILRGSRRRHGPYQYPLYKLPKGEKLRQTNRAKIVAGALSGKKLELVWVDDPIDAFFVQIQGSGQVHLDTGQLMRLGYSGQNGFPYVPIGKVLKEQGKLKKVTMQTIRQWLKAHPRQAESIMSQNPSYVYFREIKSDGPIGAMGVPLTPGRSLAVDKQFISLGTPVWLHADHPETQEVGLRKLVSAQDVGGAIKGMVRGDYYWGSGHEAGELAGRMNSVGQYYLLLPKS